VIRRRRGLPNEQSKMPVSDHSSTSQSKETPVLPDDVKRFVRRCKEEGYRFDYICIERADDKYDVWKNGTYIGVKDARWVYDQRNVIICDKYVCVLFSGNIMALVLDRVTKLVGVPEEPSV